MEGAAVNSLSDLHLTPDIFAYHLDANLPHLDVTFKGGEKAEWGNILTPTQVQDAPKVQFADAQEHASYVIFMTDPDAPSRNNAQFREWWHWIVTNVPGKDLRAGDLSKGKEHWSYVGAGPPEKTGLHRYVLLAFKQKTKKQDFGNGKGLTGDGRGKNHVEQWAKKHGLGHPVAAAAFQAEWDDYVPELYKKLGAN